MAGVLLHLAMGDPDVLDPGRSAYSDSYRRAYALGLLLPDIAKQSLIRDAGDFERYFALCAPRDIHSYEEYLLFRPENHFHADRSNPTQQDTRDPDLRSFLAAGYVDLARPVWLGVLCHLMGDKAFYYRTYCVDDPRVMRDYAAEVGELKEWDGEKWRQSRTARLYYDDYNVLNQCLEDEYGVLRCVSAYLAAPLVRELLERFHVRFSSARAEPEYMNLQNIRKYVARSRLLIRAAAGGAVEDVLRFFDGDGRDALFAG